MSPKKQLLNKYLLLYALFGLLGHWAYWANNTIILIIHTLYTQVSTKHHHPTPITLYIRYKKRWVYSIRITHRFKIINPFK